MGERERTSVSVCAERKGEGERESPETKDRLRVLPVCKQGERVAHPRGTTHS